MKLRISSDLNFLWPIIAHDQLVLLYLFEFVEYCMMYFFYGNS